MILGEPNITIDEENIFNTIILSVSDGRYPIRDWDSVNEYGERKLEIDAKNLSEEDALTYAQSLLNLYSKTPYHGTIKVSVLPDSVDDVDNSKFWVMKTGFVISAKYPRLSLGNDSTAQNFIIDKI